MPPQTPSIYARLPAAKTVARFIDEHVVALNVCVVAAFVILMAFYIGQVNTSISKGYAITNLQNNIQQLTDENGRLELAVSRVQTLDHVAQSMEILGMVPAQAPTYLNEANSNVAMAGN